MLKNQKKLQKFETTGRKPSKMAQNPSKMSKSRVNTIKSVEKQRKSFKNI